MDRLKESTSRTWYILMAAYLLYFGQSTFFPSLAGVGQLLIFVIMFVGLVNLLRSVNYFSALPSCEKWVIAMLIVLTMAWFMSPKTVSSYLLPPTATLNQFKDMVAFFIPIFTGYQIGLHKKLPTKQWLVISIILLILAINSFYAAKAAALLKFGKDESTNNAAYTFLYVLPFVPLILKRYKLAALALLAVCFIYVMTGAKRGAILCLAAVLLYLMWWYYRGKKVSWRTILGILILITAIGVGINYFFTTDDYLQQRLEDTLEGNSSARDYLYAKLWNTWLNADMLTQLFGHGSAQTVIIAGNYAHNDWLELLTDVGLLGAIIYLTIIVKLYNYSRYLQKGSQEQAAFTSYLIFWVLTTIFSMGMGITAGISMMLLGTLIGNNEAEEREVSYI